MNFATHFMAISGRSIRPYSNDPEVVWFLVVTLGSVLRVCCFSQNNEIYPGFLEALRYSAFNVVSIATTTGYSNTDYNLWPLFAPLWMLFLCCFVTCAGSTGGGIKMIRAIVLYKQVNRELVPSNSSECRLSGKDRFRGFAGQHPVCRFGVRFCICGLHCRDDTAAFVFGLDIVSSFSAVVASINNTGPGLNQVGPATTFAILTDFQTWVYTHRHAARSAGNIHATGCADSGLLA